MISHRVSPTPSRLNLISTSEALYGEFQTITRAQQLAAAAKHLQGNVSFHGDQATPAAPLSLSVSHRHKFKKKKKERKRYKPVDSHKSQTSL